MYPLLEAETPAMLVELSRQSQENGCLVKFMSCE
jgi:hypothetical protein